MIRKTSFRKGISLSIIIFIVGIMVFPNISGKISESTDSESYSNKGGLPIQVTFTRPENGIYFFDKKIVSYHKPLVLCGQITIGAEVEPENECDRIEFYVNDFLYQEIVYEGPDFDLNWIWGGLPFSKIKCEIIAYASDGNQSTDELTIWRIF